MERKFDMLKILDGSNMVEKNSNLVVRKNGKYFCGEDAPEEVKLFVEFKNNRVEESKKINRMTEEFYGDVEGINMEKINEGYELLSHKNDLIRYDGEKFYCDNNTFDSVKELVKYENDYMNKLRFMEKKIKERIGSDVLQININDVYDGLDLLYENQDLMMFDGVVYKCEETAPKCIKEVVKYENNSLLKTIDFCFTSQKIRLKQPECYFDKNKADIGGEMLNENEFFLKKDGGQYYCDSNFSEEIKEFVKYKNYQLKQSEVTKSIFLKVVHDIQK